MTDTKTKRLQLIQYWDRNIPKEVADLCESVKTLNSSFEYRFFSDESAREFIFSEFGSHAASIYDVCALPAMKADLFRYYFLYKHGGLYVDADFLCLKPFTDYLEKCHRGCLFNRSKGLTNSMMFVAEAEDPLMEVVLQRTTENIEKKASNSVWSVTGPAVLQRIQSNPRSVHHYEGFDLIDEMEFSDYFMAPGGLEYKQGDDHWLIAREKGINIFSQ